VFPLRSHRRGPKECVATLIDTKQKKSVDFEIVTKAQCGSDGHWDGSANGMEIEALAWMLPRWVGDSTVKAVVHDKDAKASQQDQDLGHQRLFGPKSRCQAFRAPVEQLRDKASARYARQTVDVVSRPDSQRLDD
jgi:hypothetical protein